MSLKQTGLTECRERMYCMVGWLVYLAAVLQLVLPCLNWLCVVSPAQHERLCLAGGAVVITGNVYVWHCLMSFKVWEVWLSDVI